MKKTVFVIAALLILSTSAFSQIDIKIGGGLGTSLPMADLAGETTDFYAGTKYGLSTGYDFHLKGKVSFLVLSLRGEIDYSTMSNTGQAEPGQGSIELSQKVLAFRVGPEFRIDIPLLPITPYLHANLAMNNISGEVTFQGVSKVPSKTYEIESATRFGLGVGAGAEISIGPAMTLDLGLAYNFLNLLGKEYNSVSSPDREDAYTSLNDDVDPAFLITSDKNIIANSRVMSNFQITASLLIGI